MSIHRLISLLILALLIVPVGSRAADDMLKLLPQTACGGWKIDGKPLLYDRETLSDRINGEAELYFPYGFEHMAAARYVPPKKSGTGMDVEIYRMGSLLDAFGMYANYRQKEGKKLSVGADSNLSGSQFYLYRERHFVHIQITGGDGGDTNTLTECAKSVAALLPGRDDRPQELLTLNQPELVKGSERYLPQSLLGYDFLNKGLMADAVVNGTTFQIFRLLGTTTAAATSAFEANRALLTQVRVESGGKSLLFLEGVDPLYGPVIILKKEGCLAGALKFGEIKGVRALLERICR
jgi:hypothetical protein